MNSDFHVTVLYYTDITVYLNNFRGINISWKKVVICIGNVLYFLIVEINSFLFLRYCFYLVLPRVRFSNFNNNVALTKPDKKK